MTIEVSERMARLLALLLKRLTWDDVARRAEDQRQRDDMLFSVESVLPTGFLTLMIRL